jgi:hypothetical protein
MTPETCPNCGADVPRNAKACPECGADEASGWAEDAHAERLGLPEETFDYENFVKEEFGAQSAKPHGLAWIWWITGVLLLLLLAIAYLR